MGGALAAQFAFLHRNNMGSLGTTNKHPETVQLFELKFADGILGPYFLGDQVVNEGSERIRFQIHQYKAHLIY